MSICSIWLNSPNLSYSFHSPAAVALLRCFSLHALVAYLVVAQVDFFYGVVDTNRVGEGLQSWHEAKAKWTVDSWAFHCSCAELPALSTGSSACLPFSIVRHRGPQLNPVSLSQLRRSLQLLITDSFPAQVELYCDDLVEAQLVGQGLGTLGEHCGRSQGTAMVKAEAGQNVQRKKRRIEQGTVIWKTLQYCHQNKWKHNWANHSTLKFLLEGSGHCELLGAFAKTQFTGLLILCWNLRLKCIHAAICRRVWETSQSNILKINVLKILAPTFQNGSNSGSHSAANLPWYELLLRMGSSMLAPQSHR